MRIVVSGSSGLVGSALIPVLERAGHRVVRLTRGAWPERAAPGTVAWDPEHRSIDRVALEGIDAAIHLAGEPIFGRWTAAKKRRIADSRIVGTGVLAEALGTLSQRPRVLVCASASGFYGDRGEEFLTEDSAPGHGFLADVCRAWEAAAEPARRAGIRVVFVRTGLVLACAGGLLKTVLLPFRLGVGGPIGRGRAYWSWIALDDLLQIYRFAIERNDLEGPVNAVAPNPVTNAAFARTLGSVLHRPALLPVPPVALRIVFGREAAQEAMLAGARLVPARLLSDGFRFGFPDLAPALRHILMSDV